MYTSTFVVEQAIDSDPKEVTSFCVKLSKSEPDLSEPHTIIDVLFFRWALEQVTPKNLQSLTTM